MKKPWPLRDALETAQLVLDGRIGLIEGCVTLASYGSEVVPSPSDDADFGTFILVASETDHLPLGEVRQRWSADALAGADAKIEGITKHYRQHIVTACANLIARFGPGKAKMTLFRPVGPKELDVIASSGWLKFPPRLPDQPIFYPVTNEEYATQIARDWNVKASGAGFVTKFEVDAYYLSRYRIQKVGGENHTEYWIPAEDLPEFNRNIVGPILVTAEFK
jgi:hypothetical protein